MSMVVCGGSKGGNQFIDVGRGAGFNHGCRKEGFDTNC